MVDYNKFIELIELCNDANVLYYPDNFIRLIHEDSVKQNVLQLPNPLFVTWDVTSKCNLSCLFCSASAKHCEKQEHNKNAMLIANKIIEWGAIYVSLRGGEPSLMFELSEVTSLFLKNGIFVEIVTNGSYIDDAFFESLGEFEHSKLRIKISCDSYIQEHNDKIRGTNSYLYAMNAMKSCKKHSINFRLQMVVCSINKNDILGTYELADKMGAKSFGPILVIPAGRGRTSPTRIELDNDIMDDLIFIKKHQGNAILEKIGMGTQAMLLYKEMLKQNTNTASRAEELHALKCNGGKSRVYVNELGDVFPCELMQYKKFLMGNLLSNSNEEIWNSVPCSEFNAIKRSDISGCKDCSNYACDTGCYALIYENEQKGGKSSPCCML